MVRRLPESSSERFSTPLSTPPDVSFADAFGLCVAIVRELYPDAFSDVDALLAAFENIADVLSGNDSGVAPAEAARVRELGAGWPPRGAVPRKPGA